MKEWKAFIERRTSPDASLSETATTPTGTWRPRRSSRCSSSAGGTISRANVMKQAASLKGFVLPLLLPGIKVNTSPDKL